ncbi:MAG: NAD-dependent protein deacylase [Tissierellia bacterium]|nr:NAD-dependent protein deacylase [Tissierellia bacterium]
MNDYCKVAKMLKDSKKTFVLTGAGISTDSGIPDFRSADSGYWTKMDPMEALSVEVLYDRPEQFYKIGYEMLVDMQNKKPNTGHLILAELEDAGLISGVITQNIDNLHTYAGSKNVLEVHGNTRKSFCRKCGRVYDFKYLGDYVERGIIPPICEHCGGVVRPDVVMFGDPMPVEFERALGEVESSDLLIVIGSSLTVSPVNYLPTLSERLVIINMTPTPFDQRADVVLNEGISEALEKIKECLND